jgi:4-azaleucine resistance transporter AzlC
MVGRQTEQSRPDPTALVLVGASELARVTAAVMWHPRRMLDASRDDRQPHFPFGEAPEPMPDEAPVRNPILLALPLAAAIGMFGISFGVLAASNPAFGGLAAIVMSATTFAGSAQFAVLSVLSAGGNAVAAILAAVLLNLRYLPIGVSVAPSMRAGVFRRFLASQLVVDESWAVAARRGGRFDIRTLIIAGAVMWVAWVGGTAIGVLGGSAIGDPNALGLDGGLAALFLALVWPQLRERRSQVAALLGATIALGLVPFTPAGMPIIAAAAAALIGLWRR